MKSMNNINMSFLKNGVSIIPWSKKYRSMNVKIIREDLSVEFSDKSVFFMARYMQIDMNRSPKAPY